MSLHPLPGGPAGLLRLTALAPPHSGARAGRGVHCETALVFRNRNLKAVCRNAQPPGHCGQKHPAVLFQGPGLCIEVAGGSPITSPAKDRANWDTSDSRALSTTADSHIVQGGPGDVPTAGQPTAQGTMAAVCVA